MSRALADVRRYEHLPDRSTLDSWAGPRHNLQLPPWGGEEYFTEEVGFSDRWEACAMGHRSFVV